MRAAKPLPPLDPGDAARASLLCYAIARNPRFRVGRHHRSIAQTVQRVLDEPNQRIMIFAPPRHGKTHLVSEFLPAWYLGHRPHHYWISATYAQDLANDIGRKVRNQLIDPEFRAYFPDCIVSRDSKSTAKLATTDDGGYFSVGVGGAITGRGGHVVLVDDPIRGRREADSPTYRKAVKDWYQDVLYTRLMPGGSVIIVQTRWHEDDLSGWLIREHAHENWTIVNLPAIDAHGEALWPESYPLETLLRIKETLGTRGWSALYQQSPTAQEGGIFKASWFEQTRYRTPPAYPERIIQSWDTAYKPAQINDYHVCSTWAERGANRYLLEVYRERLDYPALRRAARSQAEKWNPLAILIEDKASGQSLVQDLKTDIRHTVMAVQPEGDKISRAYAESAQAEGGQVWLPESAPWLTDYESELFTFPLAPNDDQVDSTTQALRYLRQTSTLNAISAAGASTYHDLRQRMA